jgi:tRNA adenylyltransferase (EC 2.7.7.25)
MSGADATAAMLDDVADAITPPPSAVAAMEAAVAELTDAVTAAAADAEVDVEVIQVGSTARGTWLADARDIDLFIAFDPAVPRAELARLGQQIGLTVLPDGETEHAEHPYVHGTHAGFAVDLVPCYGVDDATALQSAVDRTPFHTAYLAARLTDADRRAVRLTKQFMRAVGVYGSDLRTQGFSGFLVELLVLHTGGSAAHRGGRDVAAPRPTGPRVARACGVRRPPRGDRPHRPRAQRRRGRHRHRDRAAAASRPAVPGRSHRRGVRASGTGGATAGRARRGARTAADGGRRGVSAAARRRR